MRLASLVKRNAAALAERRGRRPRSPGSLSTHSSEFHELYRRFPYFGYVDVTVGRLPSFLMLSNNDDRVAQMYFWYGPDAFESLSLRIWSQLAPRANVIFDIGAFTGVYTLAAMHAAPHAEVHAFEPIRRVFGRMIDNLAVNAMGQHAHAHNVAVSNVAGDARMQIFRGPLTLSSGSSLVDKPSQTVMDTEPVRTVRGDKYARELGLDHVDLFKVDVEGAEALVLEGLGDLIAEEPDLIVEVSSPATLRGIQQLLGSDYHCVILDDVRHRAWSGDPAHLGAFSNVLFTTMPVRELDALLVNAGAALQ